MSRRGERTAADREAARRERARRRYERAGEPIPPELLEPEDRPAAAPPPPVEPPAPAYEPPPAAPHEPEPAAPHEPEPAAPYEPEPAAPHAPEPAAPFEPAPHEPPPAHDPAPAHPAPAEPAAHDPQATQQWDVSEAWIDDPAHEPVHAHAHAVPPRDAHDPHATQAYDVAAEQDAHDAAHDPHATQAYDAAAWPADEPAVEQPSEEHEAPLGTRRVSGRDHLPHVHRPDRGGKRGGDRLGKGRGVRVKRPGEAFSAGPRRRRGLAGRIFAGLFTLLAIAVAWFLVSLFQPFGGGGEGSGRVAITIPPGASAGDIGTLLADRGVVDSGFFFNLRATVSGDRGTLKSGRYTLRKGMSYAAALDALTTVAEPAAVPTVSVMVPEGRSRRETVSIVRENRLRGDYLVASRRSPVLNPRRFGAPAGATLEGFLFPATYELRRGATVRQLVDEQLRAFKANFAGIDLRYARSKQLTAYDVLTIASMVEREVSVPRERPLVAAVIYNRLRDSIPLGIDATLRFEQNDWINPLRQSVLDADTPYNTRVRQGLPPGPIGSPGLASIKAAAQPARTDALYYVVKPGTCGEHAFAATYAEHQQNVARYDAARAAAGGRSPTKC